MQTNCLHANDAMQHLHYEATMIQMPWRIYTTYLTEMMMSSVLLYEALYQPLTYGPELTQYSPPL